MPTIVARGGAHLLQQGQRAHSGCQRSQQQANPTSSDCHLHLQSCLDNANKVCRKTRQRDVPAGEVQHLNEIHVCVNNMVHSAQSHRGAKCNAYSASCCTLWGSVSAIHQNPTSISCHLSLSTLNICCPCGVGHKLTPSLLIKHGCYPQQLSALLSRLVPGIAQDRHGRGSRCVDGCSIEQAVLLPLRHQGGEGCRGGQAEEATVPGDHSAAFERVAIPKGAFRRTGHDCCFDSRSDRLTHQHVAHSILIDEASVICLHGAPGAVHVAVQRAVGPPNGRGGKRFVKQTARETVAGGLKDGSGKNSLDCTVKNGKH